MGYHKRPIIIKGELGMISKVLEEADEFAEALEQNNVILMLCELSDIYGALESLASRYNLSMQDLAMMSDATKSAFREGSR